MWLWLTRWSSVPGVCLWRSNMASPWLSYSPCLAMFCWAIGQKQQRIHRRTSHTTTCVLHILIWTKHGLWGQKWGRHRKWMARLGPLPMTSWLPPEVTLQVTLWWALFQPCSCHWAEASEEGHANKVIVKHSGGIHLRYSEISHGPFYLALESV